MRAVTTIRARRGFGLLAALVAIVTVLAVVLVLDFSSGATNDATNSNLQGVSPIGEAAQSDQAVVAEAPDVRPYFAGALTEGTITKPKLPSNSFIGFIEALPREMGPHRTIPRGMGFTEWDGSFQRGATEHPILVCRQTGSGRICIEP